MKFAASPFILLLGFLFVLIVEPADVRGQNKDLLVKVIKDGKETSVYEKLITNQTTKVYEEPRDGARVERVSAFNIFYRLKTDSGQKEKEGFCRVGDSDGKHLGWVRIENVQSWNTRFVVAPKFVNEKVTFGVDADGDGNSDFAWDEKDTPDDVTAYSFITGASTSSDSNAEETGPFPVCFCRTRIENEGTLSELNQLGEMKLEIVFAIEGGSYLATKYDDKVAFIEFLNKLAKQYVDLIREENEVDIPVRFGLIGFQDASSNYEYRAPQVLQSLTDDLDSWKDSVARIKHPENNDDLFTDTPNDGLSAVDKCLSSEIGWSGNSSKHVVLIGHNPFQVHGKMEGGKPPAKTVLAFLYDRGYMDLWETETGWLEKFGYNTSGMSVNDVLSKARPTAATVGNRLRLEKQLHVVHVGQTIAQYIGPEGMASAKKVEEILDEVERNYGQSEAIDLVLGLQAETQGYVFIAQKIVQLNAWDPIAESNYRTLGQDGYFSHMDPTEAEVLRVTRELQNKINEAIKVISDVATGREAETEGTRESNEFTKPLFKLISSTMKRSELIDKPVMVGTAFLRDETTGRSVGEKQVMVSREELTRLKGSFESLYEQFNQKRKRADRQDVNEILNDLKQSLASAATGQQLDASVNLAELITSLPLRTEALRLNAGDIAVMSTGGFEEWLDEITAAVKRLDNLLTGDPARWISISSLAKSGQRYAFLRLSELP